MKLRNNEFVKVILFALPTFCIGILYLLAFYPGIMTSDSLGQWDQMNTFKLVDWHPVMHTLFNYLITRIWYSPAAIALVQITIISLTFGYAMYIFYSINVNKKLLALLSVLFPLLPPVGLMSISIWKDIPYSAMIFLMTILLLNLYYKGSKLFLKPIFITILVLCSFGILFFRHNGIIPFIATYIGLLIVYKNFTKRIVIMFISILLTFCIIKGPIFSTMGVQPTQKSEALGILVNSIGAVVKDNGNITEAQKEKLNKVMPYKLWGEKYNPYITDSIKFDKRFNSKILSDNPVDFIKLWFEIFKQNPRDIIKAYSKQISLAWQINQPKDGYVYIYEYPIADNHYNLRSIPKNYKLNNYLFNTIDVTSKRPTIFWRPAIFMYLTFIIFLYQFVKVNKKIALVAVPLFFNIASLLISMPAQDYRYLFSNTLIFFAILPMILVKNKQVNL
ncbi:hypothetical protein CPJCM30710_09050 [Clostridium polyendosporum]|uniref:Uncharacterized protein n=1 Tax=Clostridium polyendosporum TaxID=69208 RepID=A0A919RXS8_9CLOT|nr:DUF6020 family protein [Clostridium polyendosporum]GIM28239.1 hypothetical protein CPJCM30710_09050 [Clostridium polyendosporum]